jgi:hypothetical protein
VLRLRCDGRHAAAGFRSDAAKAAGPSRGSGATVSTASASRPARSALHAAVSGGLSSSVEDEKNTTKSQRGWHVLDPAGKQVIVASSHNIPDYESDRVIVDGASISLSGSPVSPKGIAQEQEPFPRSSVRDGKPGET